MSIKGAIRRWLEPRLRTRGYHLLSDWQLAKYDQTTHTSQLLAALNVDCVLDVGANIGQYYRFLRRQVGYAGVVVSLEPVEEMYRTLVDAAPHDSKWHVHRLALGEQNTTMTINVARERTLSSFLPRNETGLQAMGYQKYLRETELDATEAVEMRRLDDVVPDIVPHRPARIFVKSDTQGYDMNVIRGARRCLDAVVALQVELSVRHVYSGSTAYLDALAELDALGYELTGVFPVQRDSALRVVNLDCVMVRSDEAVRLRARRAAAGGN